MRILVMGAYGFIGAHVTGRLMAAGHTVIAGAHDVTFAKKRLPDCEFIACDFSKDIHPDVWVSRLNNIDVVVNCVGVLQTNNPKTIEAIHYLSPRALIEACQKCGIKKFIQISATGADEGVDTDYAKTKLALEKYLKNMDYNWVILRPSLVYSSGSYGGTSLFRALAALPWIIPIVGSGKQLFQPIAMDDLTKTVQIVLENPEMSKKIIPVVGPDQISVKDLFIKIRKWLGFGTAKIIHIPLTFIRLGAWIGDYWKDIPLNTTTYKMLAYNNIADSKILIDAVGFTPSKMDEVLLREPSSVQDRWHARLFFLNPLLRITLGLLWVFSGIIPLFFANSDVFDNIFFKLGMTGNMAKISFYVTTILDIVLGIATLANWKLKWIGSIQILLIIYYTIILSVFLPEFWLDPFGAILKNIPLIVATLIMIVLSEQR